MKIIDLCPVCGGKGRFITQKCPSCSGEGAVLFRITAEIKNSIEQRKSKLSEQEISLLELYKNEFSQKEIAKRMDLTLAEVAALFYSLQKKLC